MASLAISQTSYAQLDDLFKKIPKVEDVFLPPVSTSIKDAYPAAYWLRELDKQIPVTTGETYSADLPPGFYRFNFKTFCLHAGAYAPTEGSGYLAAPLKGPKAKLIQDVLTRYDDHQEIEQVDVQLLLWGIEAGQKFSSFPPDFQMRVQQLLTPDEIAMMEVDVKEIALDLLPQDVKEILNLYSDLRTKLSDPSASYEQVEQIAVKTGIPPLGKESKNIETGTWASVGYGIYIRNFQYGFPNADIEIYKPGDVKVGKDKSGRIISIDNGSYKLELQYDGAEPKFKSALLNNISTNEEVTVENNSTNDASIKSQNDEFINLVKKSFGKKKSGRITGETIKTFTQLKTIELSINSLIDKNSWQENCHAMTANALYKFVSDIESGTNKGGSMRTAGFDIHSIVFAPGNTAVQRTGNGGNGKKKDKCKPEVILRRASPNYLPAPGLTTTMSIEIKNLGDKCTVEKVKFKLNSGRELGRCENDREGGWYDTRLDFYIDPVNGTFNVDPDSLTAEANGNAGTITISCNDYGAYGTLSAEVTIDGVVYKAKDENSNSYYVTLPLDEANDRIGDKWEKDNNVWGLPPNWDEDPNPAGQKRDGDGMTNYEEYRGFYVSDGSGGKEHKRMNPLQKELFVIDVGQIFAIDSWKAASGIDAYWLDTSMVYGPKGGLPQSQPYRWANFCSGYSKGSKYAVNIVKIDGLIDKYTLCQGQYFGCDAGSPPKNAFIVYLPDRMKAWLLELADSCQSWLITYPGGVNLGGYFLSKDDMQNYLSVVRTPKKFDELCNYEQTEQVVHEVGHACCLPHHGGGDTTKLGTGSKDCPMRYVEWESPINTEVYRLRHIFDQIDINGNVIVSYTSWRFCKTQDNCWSKIDVNDR